MDHPHIKPNKIAAQVIIYHHKISFITPPNTIGRIQIKQTLSIRIIKKAALGGKKNRYSTELGHLTEKTLSIQHNHTHFTQKATVLSNST